LGSTHKEKGVKRCAF
jgi:hypothetical protein